MHNFIHTIPYHDQPPHRRKARAGLKPPVTRTGFSPVLSPAGRPIAPCWYQAWWCRCESPVIPLLTMLIHTPTPILTLNMIPTLFPVPSVCIWVSVCAGNHKFASSVNVGVFIVHVWCVTQTRPRFKVSSEGHFYLNVKKPWYFPFFRQFGRHDVILTA